MCIAAAAMPVAHADPLEESMSACRWGLYDSNITEFRKSRARLPTGIEVKAECKKNGPTYLVRTEKKTLVIQDGWIEGDNSTAHFFAKEQPSSRYWIFSYQGYEWSGLMFINRRTGAMTDTPGNSCEAPVFNSSGNRAVLRCYPEYGSGESELYYINLGSKLALSRLHRYPPGGGLTVSWQREGEVTIQFATQTGKIAVRKYRIPKLMN